MSDFHAGDKVFKIEFNRIAKKFEVIEKIILSKNSHEYFFKNGTIEKTCEYECCRSDSFGGDFMCNAEITDGMDLFENKSDAEKECFEINKNKNIGFSEGDTAYLVYTDDEFSKNPTLYEVVITNISGDYYTCVEKERYDNGLYEIYFKIRENEGLFRDKKEAFLCLMKSCISKHSMKSFESYLNSVRIGL